MHRFFVDPECIGETSASVVGPVARQAARVLRLRPGESVVLLDNTGWEYSVRLDSVSSTRLEGEVVEKQKGTGDPSVLVTLYQGALKSDKLETVLQKGTEIGVSAFVPVLSRRSVVRSSKDWSEGKYTRWRKIITEAAEQSGRSLIPYLGAPMTWQQASTSARGVRLMAWEGDPDERRNENGITRAGFREAVLPSMDRIRKEGLSLFVGPEGGFDAEEVEEARASGVAVVSLGRRILRGETAGLAMAAAVMYEAGELGG